MSAGSPSPGPRKHDQIRPFSNPGKLEVREGIEFLTYHRKPTPSEIRFGHGAIHYADFTIGECCFNGTRIPKKRLRSKHDGLIYTR